MNPNKAAGPDGIHPKIVIECKDILAKPMADLFNKSLKNSFVPRAWKHSLVTPIFKTGNKHLPENYRPISISPICSNIMQKIIREKIINHMTLNNLFSNNQFGFIQGRSCQLQLLESLEDWTTSLDNGSDIDIIFYDFKKAFDTLSHNKLIHQLNSYGIGGKILSWIKDLLTNRTQEVVINNEHSDTISVRSGVPQGSAIGPTLFLIFINDLPETADSAVKLFADDTKTYTDINTLEDCTKLQRTTNNFYDWSQTWSMDFNIKKCKRLHIGKHQYNEDYTMENNNGERCQIQNVTEEEDLGVIIDTNLKFDSHITAKINKANRNLGIINRSFTYMDKPMFLNLYKALVRPHLEYASPVWSPFLRKQQVAIENVQRRATKLLKNISQLSYKDRLLHLGLPSLEYRRNRADMLQVLKIVHNYDKISNTELLRLSKYSRTRGHNFKLQKQIVKSEIRKKIASVTESLIPGTVFHMML